MDFSYVILYLIFRTFIFIDAIKTVILFFPIYAFLITLYFYLVEIKTKRNNFKAISNDE